MLSKLDEYYETNGISANSYINKRLKCKHFPQCSSNKSSFTPAKEAFVSTIYEDHSIPRLLIISLDPKPTFYYNDIEHRTLQAIREHEETTPTESYYDWKPRSHWRQTYDMIFILLQRFIRSRNRNEIRHYFAHTNSAKCHDKEGSEQASNELFMNCCEYLPNEISILDPDVVITQGSKKYFSFMNTFPIKTDSILYANYPNLQKVHPILINGHNAIWIETNHPCRRDSSYQVEDVINFTRYSELISELWQSTQGI